MVNIATFNVRGLSNVQKRRKIFNFLHKKLYDIICIQEAHCSKSQEKVWKSQWGGQIIFLHGASNARGCMILIKKNIATKIHFILNDKIGHYNIVDISVNNNRIVLCNIYAPNSDDVTFFQDIANHLTNLKAKHIIMSGDFNTVLEQKDKKSSLGQNNPGHPKCVDFLKTIMSQFNLIDIWRVRHPEKERFTWVEVKPYILME